MFDWNTEIGHLKSEGLYRQRRIVSSDQGPEVEVEGRALLNFSSNNYLGLANHPLLRHAAVLAIQKYGVGSGASRLITGSMTLHEELEKKIAAFKGVQEALLFNSGTQANMGVIPAITGEGDVIFSDELNHASLIDGCRLSKATTSVYRHNDMGHLEELLAVARPYEAVIVTDTVFSMDGDLAPLPQILDLAEKYDATVYVDEAHATGIFGKTGRGVLEHFGIPSDHPRFIQMGTLGKALGSFGAYVCGSHDLVDWLVNKARTFIYSTSLPPAMAGASIAALDVIRAEPEINARLWENVAYFKAGLERISKKSKTWVLAKSESPILPLIIGGEEETMALSRALFEKGVWAQGIRPPTVPQGSSRIRFTVMATHTREHLDKCLGVLNEIRK